MNLSGNPTDYLKAFLGGIALSLTPCVYPLIPITASFIGVRAGQSKLKGLVLSLVYVTGIAITYSLLGIAASLTGRIFGAFSAHPLAYFLVGVIVILAGASMLDVFILPLPNFIKLPAAQKKGYPVVFLVGLTSGLIVSPCLTPVLGAILAYLFTQKNLLYGATLLFSFAYGMGFILIIIGTFSAAIFSLPKLGKWMLYIKRGAALILILMGLYFIGLSIRGILK